MVMQRRQQQQQQQCLLVQMLPPLVNSLADQPLMQLQPLPALPLAPWQRL
jgi:hypothetical protein